jgi:hypothetical protein
LEFPGERCINFKFPGEGYINLGISRGEGTLTLKFPEKGAFRLWNSGGVIPHGISEGGVNFMGWKFHGRTYVR